MSEYLVIEKKGSDVMLNEEIYRNGKWEKCYGRLADMINEDLKDYVFLVKITPSPDVKEFLEKKRIAPVYIIFQEDDGFSRSSYQLSDLIEEYAAINKPISEDELVEVMKDYPLPMYGDDEYTLGTVHARLIAKAVIEHLKKNA